MTRCTFGDTNVFFYFPKFERNIGSHWMHFACICHIVFRIFFCLQINLQPFYLRQLLKFHPFDWLIEIYLQTEGQGTHHKMVSLQPMLGFSPLLLVHNCLRNYLVIETALDEMKKNQHCIYSPTAYCVSFLISLTPTNVY